jgi:hypothetical protein
LFGPWKLTKSKTFPLFRIFPKTGFSLKSAYDRKFSLKEQIVHGKINTLIYEIYSEHRNATISRICVCWIAR